MERKLIGNWEIVNSTLTSIKSNVIVHQTENLGVISLNKTKIDESLIDLNYGSWNFTNFIDTIIPPSGELSWTSTDKGDYKKVPWEMDIYFSTKYVKDSLVQGSFFFNCYHGYFKVTELQKKSRYKIVGEIYHTSERPRYSWIFELKKK